MRAARIGAWLVAAVLSLPGPATAAPARGGPVPRTIVVRGLVRNAEGAPLAGAHVGARGTATVHAITNDRGRYSMSLPLGMPAAVRERAFHLEVRAEADGRRMPLAGGGESLVLDATWDAAAGRVRVTGNREQAATAVATALEVDEVTIAWIEADFGGAQAGLAPRPSAPAPARETAASSPSRPIAHDTAAVARAHERAPQPVRGPQPDRGRPAGTDSTARSKPAKPGASRRDPVAATVPPPARPKPAVPAPSPSAPPSRAPLGRDSARVAAATSADGTSSPRPSPVRVIDPYAPRSGELPPDTCRCTIRGTVEIQWDRPLEFNTPMRVEIDAPGQPPAELSLFMGAPREFRFGNLPCGDWRLTLVAGGRFRYVDSHGDTTRVVRCPGPTQTRVVLVPVRR